MSKDIKDYLHLYLGCEVEVDQSSANMGIKKGLLIGIAIRGDITFYDVLHSKNIHQSYYKFPVKPTLRPLSDMTEEEAKGMELWANWHDANFMGDDWEIPFFKPNQFVKLLSFGFDLFGLINSGLAIDKTKLQ